MTITIELNDLANLQNEATAVTLINQNNETVEGGFTTALNTTGDQMQGTLDMNSNQIINLAAPATANSPVRLQDLSTVSGGGTVSNIPTGGSTGDALVKKSNTNYDIEWSPNVADVTSGTNVVISGANPTVIATVTSPTFTSLTTTTLNAGNFGTLVSGGQGITVSGTSGATVAVANVGTFTTSNDTNVTVSITTNPTNILMGSATVAMGWTGTLAATRLTGTDITTLANLASIGTITTGVWNATAISSAAGTLTGTTLAGNVVSSSLGKVGTITTGVWNGTSIAAANLVLTDVSTLSNLASLGTITTGTWNAGTVTASTIAGGSGTSSTLTIESTSASGTGDSILFKTGAQTTRMSVSSTGNISMGTNNPGSMLLDLNRNSATVNTAAGANIMQRWVAANNLGTIIELASFGNLGNNITGGIAGGTMSTPTAATSGVSQFLLAGYTYSSASYVLSSAVQMISAESATTGCGTKINLLTTPTGSTVLNTGVIVQPSGGLSINTTTDPGSGLVMLNSSTFMTRTKTSFTTASVTSGVATLTNAPVSTNPTKWIPIDDNGVTRYIPAW